MSKVIWVFADDIAGFVITPDRQQSKTLQTIGTDQKSLETVFSIANCRPTGDNGNRKLLFLTIFDLCSLIVLMF